MIGKKDENGVTQQSKFLRDSEGPQKLVGPLPYLRIMKQQKQHEGSGDCKKRWLAQVGWIFF